MPTDDEHDDRLAARAARLVLDGDVSDVGLALRRLGGPDRLAGLARRHLEGLLASRHGGEVVSDRRRARLEDTLAVMETIEDLEDRLADDRWIHRGVRVAGRLATGRFDPDAMVHLRQHGDRPLDQLELELMEMGAIEMARRSDRTRFGVISSLEFQFGGGGFRCRRCPPDQVPLESRDLFHGRPVPVLDLEGVRRLIDSLESQSPGERD